MSLWVVLALAAGTFQTARNGLARSLAEAVSPWVNAWARFAFALPYVAVALAGLLARRGPLALPPAFLGDTLVTALCQLSGTVLLVMAFRRASFIESIVINKLEVVFAALLGVVFFAERPSPLGWLGIVLCALGVVWMNLGRTRGLTGLRRALQLDAGALLAMASAVLLVLASFYLKRASLALVLANPRVGSERFEVALYTLFATTLYEVVLLTAALVLAPGGGLAAAVRRHGRRMALLGTASFCGSLCWFWAYSLALVAYVKAVGQIEAVLSVAVGLIVWRELARVRRQLPGVALVIAGIALVLLG